MALALEGMTMQAACTPAPLSVSRGAVYSQSWRWLRGARLSSMACSIATAFWARHALSGRAKNRNCAHIALKSLA